MKIRTSLSTIPLFIGLAGLGGTLNGPKNVNTQSCRDIVTISEQTIHAIKSGYNFLTEHPEVSTSLAFFGICGIAGDNKKWLREQYYAKQSKCNEMFDTKSYEELKKEISDCNSYKSDDGTIAVSPNYSKLKETITEKPHKVLDDGTIRQYSNKVIKVQTERTMPSGCSICGEEDYQIPIRDLLPNGNIIEYNNNIKENDIKDEKGKYKTLNVDQNGLITEFIAGKKIYSPDGKLKIYNSDGTISETVVPNTKILHPDGTIEIFHKPNVRGGFFRKPTSFEKKTVYKPDNTRTVLEIERYNSSEMQYVNGQPITSIPESEFSFYGNVMLGEEEWDEINEFEDIWGDLDSYKTMKQKLQKIADIYHFETGENAKFHVDMNSLDIYAGIEFNGDTVIPFARTPQYCLIASPSEASYRFNVDKYLEKQRNRILKTLF